MWQFFYVFVRLKTLKAFISNTSKTNEPIEQKLTHNIRVGSRGVSKNFRQKSSCLFDRYVSVKAYKKDVFANCSKTYGPIRLKFRGGL